MNIQDRAEALHRLHTGEPLLLLNAWDAGSARMAESLGARAIATTSAGLAWSLGWADGQQIERAEALAALRRIVRAVSLPVTADIESGFGAGQPADVAETVQGVIAAGAVGINLEDSPGLGGSPLRDTDSQCERIATARRVADREGVRLFINARTDVFLEGVGEPAGRLSEVLRRAAAYLDAGADGVFVPGVVDAHTIRQLAQGIAAPLNVLAQAGCPPLSELRSLGVARVSLGSRLAGVALGAARKAAQEVLTGVFPAWPEALSYAEAQRLYGHG